jgi:Ran GTPase-activating protein (RanGAP) involved in mRNA processing and transport
MPMKGQRKHFKWEVLTGRKSLYDIRKSSNVKKTNFSNTVLSEAKMTLDRMRLRKFELARASPKPSDFKEGEDPWNLKESPVRKRLEERFKKDYDYICKLHSDLEIACNRLTVSPKSSPPKLADVEASTEMAVKSIVVNEYNISFGYRRSSPIGKIERPEGLSLKASASAPQIETVHCAPSRAKRPDRRLRRQTTQWDRMVTQSVNTNTRAPIKLPPSEQAFFTLAGREPNRVCTHSDVPYSEWRTAIDGKAESSRTKYLDAIGHRAIFPKGRAPAQFADEGQYADKVEHPLYTKPAPHKSIKETSKNPFLNLPRSVFVNNLKSKNVSMSHQDVSSHQAYGIAAALKQNNVIECLDLSHNEAIGPVGIECIADALRIYKHATWSMLSKLDLSRTKCGDKGAEELARALGDNNTITELYLRSNKIGDRGALALAKVLEEKNDTIKVLDLRKNAIGGKGGAAFGKAFEEDYHHIIRFYLGWNPIGDYGASEIAKGVLNAMGRGRPTLKHLDLSACNVSDKAMEHWTPVLKGKWMSITYLDLSHNNRLTEQAAKAIADGLAGNTKLRTLKLGYSMFGVRGLCDILKSLTENFGLVSLGLEECCFDADSDEVLQFVFEACCFMLQQQRKARLKKYRQMSSTCVMLEFPHRAREVHTGLLLQQKYRDILNWESCHSDIDDKPAAPEGAWNPEKSVFKERRKKGESKDFFCTETLTSRAFELDWKRCVGDKDMADVFQVADEKELHKELEEIKESIRRRYRHIMDVFTWCSNFNGGDPGCMSHIDFRRFLEITCLVGGKTTKRDFDELFTLANAEVDEDSAEGVINPDKQLMRFEFLEILLRASMKKYFLADPSDAVDKLFDTHFIPHLGIDVVHDRDDYRRERLYTMAVEETFSKWLRKLKLLFRKRADRGKYMSWERFLELMVSFDQIDEEFSQRQARLAFQWSKMRVSDEMKGYQKLKMLDFVSLLEVIARIADYKTIPPKDTLRAAGYKNFSEYQTAWKKNARLWLGRRPSAGGWQKRKTQPLSYKLDALLHYWEVKGVFSLHF